MNYLNWDQKTITDFSEYAVNDLYGRGYLFTRLGKGVMHQTRSVRLDLEKFSLSSENRRILNNTDGLHLDEIPLPFDIYHWKIGKLGKDFYEKKFGSGIFSASKIKELLTDMSRSNFNTLFKYSWDDTTIGFAVCYVGQKFLHYSYPFYDIDESPKSMGLGMMLRAILHAQKNGLKYIYLGSLQRPADTYKLQFDGLEWFDGREWQTNIEDVKRLLT